MGDNVEQFHRKQEILAVEDVVFAQGAVLGGLLHLLVLKELITRGQVMAVLEGVVSGLEDRGGHAGQVAAARHLKHMYTRVLDF